MAITTVEQATAAGQRDREKALSAGLHPITGASLTPAEINQFQSPQPTITPSITTSTVDATGSLVLTPQEQQGQTLSERMMALNEQIAGRPADQLSAETAFGLDAKKKTVQDLSLQLQDLTNQASAIPLQMQQYAAGGGMTASQLTTQTNQELRTNTIKALQINSLLASAQGNVAYAQSLADKSVETKYAPLEAQYEAQGRNLALILSSPKYTLEQKNRATKQQEILDAKKETLEQQKADAKFIQNLAITMAEKGGSALQLQQIMKMTDPNQAILAATQTGLLAPKPVAIIDTASYDSAKLEAIQLFETDIQRNADKKVSPDLYAELRMKIPASKRDDFDKWAIDRGYLSDETIRTQTTVGTIPKRFIDANYIRTLATTAELKDLAKTAEFKWGNITTPEHITKYINSLMVKINESRDRGSSDKEIDTVLRTWLDK